MNELMLFNNNEFGEIRGLIINDEPWFVGKDITKTLGYENQNRDIINHVDEEDRIMLDKTQYENGIEFDYKQLGQRGGWIINESGLYSLILSSKLPSAKAFKSWVTHEVLPSIRKTGKYEMQNFNEFPELLNDMNRLVEDMKYKIEEQDKQIEEIKHLVGIRAKDVFDYGKIIKEHLGISKVNKDYNIIKEMFFYEVGVSKWEDLNYSRENVKLLIDICNDYKPSIQLNMFDD